MQNIIEIGGGGVRSEGCKFVAYEDVSDIGGGGCHERVAIFSPTRVREGVSIVAGLRYFAIC